MRRSRFKLRLPILITAVLCLLLTAPDVQAKTYVITAGGRTLTYTTGPETADIPPIRRGLAVTLRYHGEESHHTSSEETVGEFLARLDLPVTEADTLSHPQGSPITDGMELSVDAWLTRQEVYAVTIPHETAFCADASLPEGVEEVLIPGQDGELLVTAQVTYRNGQEVSREVTGENQTRAPVAEVIAQGAAVPVEEEPADMPVIRDGYITMPSGEVLTYYKTDNVTATGYTHTDPGCDLITSTGTTVRYGTAAVDPRFIPYGTRMLIVSHDGQRYYGIATAEDCGGAIKRDKMDLYFPTRQECLDFGRRRCTIYFLG